MSSKRRSLGRNLNALLGSVSGAMPAELNAATEEKKTVSKTAKKITTKTSATPKKKLTKATAVNAAPPAIEQVEGLKKLSVKSLQRGRYQPRRVIDEAGLESLADSIKAHGILQPIVVRALAQTPDQFEIVAGERRWRAASLAGLTEVPVLIRDFSDEEAMALALIENIQREDLNIIDEALAIERLLKEFNLTHQQVATAIGRSRGAISNTLRLLNLTPPVRDLLERGDLEMGHARALLSLGDAEQVEMANVIVQRGFSVRDTEQWVKRLQQAGGEKKIKEPVDPDIMRLQDRLTKQLNLKVQLQHQANGKGKVVLKYKNPEQLQKLVDCLSEHV